MLVFVSSLIGYLLGSLPFGVFIAKLHGICIFDHGSGNPGATNVLRVLGKRAGYMVFFCDALKGIVAACIGLHFDCPYWTLLSALLGHSYSLFIHFKGGKGVATLIGGLLVLIPQVLMIGLIVWLCVFKFSHYVSLASIAFVVSLPLMSMIYYPWDIALRHVPALTLFAGLVLWRHRSNLRRLFTKTENRF